MKIKGLSGEGKVLDLACMPGESEERAKVGFYRVRSGKLYTTMWFYSKDCVIAPVHAGSKGGAA